MDKIVEITNKEWADLTHQVGENERQLENNTNRLNRHSQRLDELEDEHIRLPLAIQQAVENGMSPVLEKVLAHDNKFATMEIEKERIRAERAESELEDRQERKRWMTRLIISGVIGVLITSVLGGIISFYVAVFLNNGMGG